MGRRPVFGRNPKGIVFRTNEETRRRLESLYRYFEKLGTPLTFNEIIEEGLRSLEDAVSTGEYVNKLVERDKNLHG